MTYHLTVHTVIMPMYKKTNKRERERERDRETERQRDRETERQRDRDRWRQRQTDRHRQTDRDRERQTDRQAGRHTYRQPCELAAEVKLLRRHLQWIYSHVQLVWIRLGTDRHGSELPRSVSLHNPRVQLHVVPCRICSS